MLEGNFELAQIKALKESEVEEGLQIDYKETVLLKNRDSKTEFVQDIISFANSAGGHLLIGVAEKKGVITEIKGIDIDDGDPDRYLQQIENIIGDLIKPRIIGIQVKAHQLENKKYVVDIYIPQSYSGPHMAKGKFFGRNLIGKYPLDYNEIRHKFLLQSGLQKQINEYHLTRIMKIKANEGHWDLPDGAKALLNIIPYASMTVDRSYIDLKSPRNENFEPFYARGYDFYINFHGIGAKYSGDNSVKSYHHLTHTGITELADILMLRNGKIINTDLINQELNKALTRIKNIYCKYDIQGQFALCFSLLDVKNYIVTKKDRTTQKINDSDLIFPTIVFNGTDDPVDILKPIGKLLLYAIGQYK